MNELKPCPFCGAQVKLMAIAGEPYPPTYEVNLGTVSEDSDDICYVHCPTCGANWHIEVRVDAFPMDTIAAWNRRPTPENKPLTLEQLRQMDGEPVYIVVDGRPDLNAWHMVRRTDVGIIAIGAAAQTIYNYDGKLNFEGGTYYNIEHGILYGKTWLAYARKPEQEEK